MVIKFLADDPKHPHVRCVCDCGNVCEPLWGSLTSERTQSCGCIRRENTGELAKTHGLSRTREWHIWIDMIARCYNRNNKSYRRYGGKGVRVTERWRDDVTAFVADKGPAPSPKHSIDRWPDPNGDYTPENTRWATDTEQANNRRNNLRITWNGRTLTISEWSRELNMSESAIRQRLTLMKWTPERTFTTPAKPFTPRRR